MQPPFVVRPSLSQLLAIVLAGSILVALVGVAVERPWWVATALRPGMLVVALLVIAPAVTIGVLREGQPISRGLGRAAAISGGIGFALGLLLLGLMFFALSVAGYGVLLSVLYIIVGLFAMTRVRQTRSSWTGGRPARAYLGPAVAGVVTLVILSNTALKAPEWTFDRNRAGGELERLAGVEKMALRDSGHFTASPDMQRVDTFVLRRTTVTLTPDGFILRASPRRLSFDCVVYMGSTPPSDADEIEWSLPERHPQPRLVPGHVGCFRGVEQSGDTPRRIRGLLLALMPAALGVGLAFAKPTNQ